MKTPESLEPLVDYGIIQEVVRPLMSGKEAQIYVVLCRGEEVVAKVYKEASQRTFKHRIEYTEGRRTRNSRDQRAVSKRTRHGRKQDEAAWRNAEVDTIYRLRDAGVRVPEPIEFVDGVLVMELVKNAQGDPAPRLGDLSFGANEAHEIHRKLIQEVVRMLCAGVVHGDLSDFNVLMGVDGPVLIDFPQSVDPAHNQNARKFLSRDVENLHRFLERFAPGGPRRAYAQEMWSLYESNRLEPDTELRGDFRGPTGKADTREVLALIDDANFEEQARRRARGVETPVKPLGGAKPMREVVDFTKEAKARPGAGRRVAAGRGARPERPRSRPPEERVTAKASVADVDSAPKKRRSRRRRRRSTENGGEPAARAPRGETPTAQKKTLASEAANDSKRRRGGGRPRTRAGSEETLASAPGSAKGRARPATAARSGGDSGGPAGGPDRRARRRRRRPRSADSRKTT